MQIGQILVEQHWVDPKVLARALAAQPRLRRRICSLLIQRGELDPDHAARALSQQHRVAGVLQRHLEFRDLALVSLLPAAIARAHIALPIGRTGAGDLIICVRDPSAAARAAIAAAVVGPVVIAVAPATQLEQLVEETYAPAPPDAAEVSFEVDLSTRPIAIIHDIAPATPAEIPMVGDPLDHLGSMTLVGLDDARVAKDPSQSGQHAALLPRVHTGSYTPPRTTTGSQPPAESYPRTATGSHPARTITGPQAPPGGTPPAFRGPTLESAIAAIERSASLEAAADAAMHHLAGRFHRAVWFTIHEGAALGERGHGDQLTIEVIQAITVPLAAPSLVQLAHDTRQLATAPPPGAGPIQDRLTRSLGYPRTPAALPIEVDRRVAFVIAVGDPFGDAGTAARDLEQLGGALNSALGRIAAK